jgi:hypothetical protein
MSWTRSRAASASARITSVNAPATSASISMRTARRTTRSRRPSRSPPAAADVHGSRIGVALGAMSSARSTVDQSQRRAAWNHRRSSGMHNLDDPAGRDATGEPPRGTGAARLRRLASQTPPADEVFAAVAWAVGAIVDVDATHMGRYDPDHTVVSVAQSARYRAGPPIARGFRSRATAFRTGSYRTPLPARARGREHAACHARAGSVDLVGALPPAFSTRNTPGSPNRRRSTSSSAR